MPTVIEPSDTSLLLHVEAQNDGFYFSVENLDPAPQILTNISIQIRVS